MHKLWIYRKLHFGFGWDLTSHLAWSMQCNLVNEHAVSYAGTWMAIHVCWEMCTKTAAALTAHVGSGSRCVLPLSLVFISLLFEMIQAKSLRNGLCVIFCYSNWKYRVLFTSLFFEYLFEQHKLKFIFFFISVLNSVKANSKKKGSNQYIWSIRVLWTICASSMGSMNFDLDI